MCEPLDDLFLDITSVNELSTVLPTLGPKTWEENKEAFPVAVTGAGDVDGTGKKTFFLHLEAKPGKEDAVRAFLWDIHKCVDEEPLNRTLVRLPDLARTQSARADH
ncbi:hypothetical protein DL98DRAFT_534063 [Cadophora sp. DSE1049]|nr:hypothetical protein DL98DRAFT_534063 [Cadophora sp. DSE1049]